MSLPAPSTRRPAVATTLQPGVVVLVLVAAMWCAEVLDAVLPVDADRYGIRARTLDGLAGIPLAPFLHAGFGHLMSNTIPCLVLGLLVAWRAGRELWRILAVVVLLGGLGVWLLAPSGAVTIGASGMVFGLMGYLLAAAVIGRQLVDVLLAVAVLFLYGGTLWATTPFGVAHGVSWLAHLCGLAAGVVAALWVAPRPGPAR